MKEKRSRYLDLLPRRKGRPKVLAALSSGRDIDYSLVVQKLPAELSAALPLLRKLGARRNCYVIADESEYDGSELALDDALIVVRDHSFGVVLSLVPGKLVVLKHESPSPTYVLKTGGIRR
jgi:hypothetical protein